MLIFFKYALERCIHCQRETGMTQAFQTDTGAGFDTSAWCAWCWCQSRRLSSSIPRCFLWPSVALAVLLLLELPDSLIQKAASSYRNLLRLGSLLTDHLLHHLTVT